MAMSREQNTSVRGVLEQKIAEVVPDFSTSIKYT